MPFGQKGGTMPKRRYGTRRRTAALTHDQKIELWLGPRSSAGLQSFPDDCQAADAYWAHRDELMEWHRENFTLTWAFKRYELPGLQRQAEREREQRKTDTKEPIKAG